MNTLSFIFCLICLAFGGAIYLDNRPAIRKRFSDLIRIKVGGSGAELEFRQGLDQVEDQTRIVGTLTHEQAPNTIRARGEVSGPPIIEAQLPPAYVVQQAWLNVRRAIMEVARSYNLPRMAPDRQNDPMTQHLFNEIGLSDADQGVIDSLRHLRNEAVHQGDETSLTITDALRYRDIANGLVQRIEAHKRPSE